MKKFRDLTVHVKNNQQFDLIKNLLTKNGEQLGPFGRFHFWDNDKYNYIQYDSTQNKWITFVKPETQVASIAYFITSLPNRISFRDVYQFPLKAVESTRSVYDSEGVFVFHVFDDVDTIRLLQMINGETEPKVTHRAKYEGGKITVGTSDTLLIKGWGYLTSASGGLDLGVELAAQMQDEICNYLVSILNGEQND